MLTIRVSPAVRHSDVTFANAIADAVRHNPLCGQLRGTVIVGGRGVGVLAMGDTTPRVMVMLGEPDARDPLARANARRADAIVAIGQSAQRAIVCNNDLQVSVIAVDDPRDVLRDFLSGTTRSESAAAWRVVRQHRALAKALHLPVPPEVPAPLGIRGVVEAILEAVIAIDQGYTHRMEHPTG